MKEEKALYSFYVAGVKFHNLHECIDQMDEGQYLALVPEPDNKYDPNAIKIIYDVADKEYMVGYVPAKISAEVTAAMEVEELLCKITQVNPDAKTWEQLRVDIVEEGEDG